MRNSLTTQTLLCLVLGPIGLIYSSTQYAITATLVALVPLLAFRDFLIWTLLTAYSLSLVIGVLLVRANQKRSAQNDFELSHFVGTVSCKVIRSGGRKGSYQPLLNKLRFRRRMGRSLNIALGVLCMYFTARIVLPDVIPGIAWRDDSKETLASAHESNAAPFKAQPLMTPDDNSGYTLKSNNFVQTANGLHRAELSLKCHNNKTVLSLRSTDILGTESTAVSVIAEGRLLHNSVWRIHDDYHTAFSPDPINTLKHAVNHSIVTIHYKPYNTESANDAQFNGSLLNSAVIAVRKACHW